MSNILFENPKKTSSVKIVNNSNDFKRVQDFSIENSKKERVAPHNDDYNFKKIYLCRII